MAKKYSSSTFEGNCIVMLCFEHGHLSQLKHIAKMDKMQKFLKIINKQVSKGEAGDLQDPRSIIR